MSEKVYLKPNVVIEPLFERWYAWSHLISPATSAMNVTDRHMKILGSYIQAPQAHAAAVKNPKMRGGPFVDYNRPRVEEIKALRQQSTTKQADLFILSESLRTLDKMLQGQAKGFSLEALYQQVPEPLKGYVELVYDLNNNPSYRIFESLLYKSNYYNKSFQGIALWLTNDDERPFVLSTPRLDEEGLLFLDIPFDHQVIDKLSRMKRIAGDSNEIRDLLNLDPDQETLFDSFFTTNPPPVYEKYTGEKIRMRYFGHACILIETKEISILIDPVISYYGYQSDVSRFSYADLPDSIDYVLITHNHQDHILLESLLQIRYKIKNIIIPKGGNGSLQDPGLKLMFRNIGFEHVIEIEEMESLVFNDCTITGIPFIGEHSDLDIRSKMCHHVRIGDMTMLFVADSCNVEPRLYELVHHSVGNIDVIFIGMECDGAPLTWLYGPLLTNPLAREQDNSRRLAGSNYERAKDLVTVFNPSEVYVYAMGQEPWLEYISSIKYTPESNPIIASDKLIRHCNEKGLTAERLFGEKELLYEKQKKMIVQ